MQESLFEEIEPYNSGMLPVSSMHSIYYEECGNREGKAVAFLHGGPGSGSAPIWRRYFDPRLYRIVLFDQRGCGKSTPYASLVENTASDLVEDTEKLRVHLAIDRWQLVGGSWGSTLALAYAQRYSERVSALILYGIFLGTAKEIEWFYQSGANAILPDAWEDYCRMIPENQRHEMVKAYYRLLNSDDSQVQLQAAHEWSMWEARGLRLIPDPAHIASFVEPEKALAQARIECHFMTNHCFLQSDQIINNISIIRHIPCLLIHGRYDLVCPVATAWTLHKSWPESKLIIVADAGHSAREPGIQKQIVLASNRFGTVDS